MSNDRKVMVISLDGVTWDVLGPWAEQGLLPHIAGLLTSGVSGNLRSTIPPVTAPAWASFQTGKNPGKHGLAHFTRYQQGTYETPIVDASSIKLRTIWQILSESGKRVGIINVPLTYPPVRVNGFMISGMLTPEVAKGFYPPQLHSELISQIGDYQIFTPVRTVDYLGVRDFVRNLAYLAQKRAEAALHMLSKEDWDFFMVHFQATDILQHALWSYLDPAHPDFETSDQEERQHVVGFYEHLDTLIGRLIQQAGENRSVILMSDHGFGPVIRRVYINRWLAQQGLLSMSGGSFNQRMLRLAESTLRRGDVLKIRRRFIKPHSRTEGLVQRLTGDMLIDWERTKAFAMKGAFVGLVCMNCRGREAKGIVELGAEREEIRDAIAAKLLSFEDPTTGELVIKNVFKREDIYHGAMLDSLPDLVVEPADGYMIVTSFKGDTLVESMPQVMTGTHRMDGILALKGEPFLKGTTLDGAEIADLAPTILYLMGVAVPGDMDGKVLGESLKASYREAHPVHYEAVEGYVDQEGQEVYSPGEAEDVKERLAGLGYLS